MTYAAPAVGRPTDLVVSTWHSQSLAVPLVNAAIGGATDQNWIAVLVAVYVPFVVPEPVIVTKLAWSNGAAVAGNIDIGIYSAGGTRLVSKGSTAQANTGLMQVVDVTDTALDRGQYYMAMASDTSGATQKVSAWVPAQGICQSFGLLEETLGALALPATATFVKYARAFVPLFGAYLNRVTP